MRNLLIHLDVKATDRMRMKKAIEKFPDKNQLNNFLDKRNKFTCPKGKRTVKLLCQNVMKWEKPYRMKFKGDFTKKVDRLQKAAKLNRRKRKLEGGKVKGTQGQCSRKKKTMKEK